MNISGYTLVMTCGACPEQYDVFFGDEEVGYLRLRHGHFRAEHMDEVVFEALPKGDGVFESYERVTYLRAAIEAIDTARLKKVLDQAQKDWAS